MATAGALPSTEPDPAEVEELRRERETTRYKLRPREPNGFGADATYTTLAPGLFVGTGPVFGGRVGLSLGRLWAAREGVGIAVGGLFDYSLASFGGYPVHLIQVGPEFRLGGRRGPWFVYALFSGHGGAFVDEGDVEPAFGVATGVGFVKLIGPRGFVGTELTPRLNIIGVRYPQLVGALAWRLVIGWRF